MSMLDLVKGISQEPSNNFVVFMGKPGSGKTTYAGTLPKPMLYVSIDTDGGGEVLKCYGDDEVKVLNLQSDKPGVPGSKHIQTKVMELLDELSGEHPYKSVVFDAYSSIEESLVKYLEANKGSKLNLQERGIVNSLMLALRDKIVDLARKDVVYAAISHIKYKEDVDNITGETTANIIPKMSQNNGNILLERASAVIYCARKTIVNPDGSRRVAFLTYLGAHPNMDTKLRTKHKLAETGLYMENFTYDKLLDIMNGNTELDTLQKVEVVESVSNPFNESENVENEGGKW